MKIIGIICEYNPFHLGHQKQIDRVRAVFGGDCGIVCLMSGNFVQRGHPAVFDKALRARAALECGADLVLELPTPYALSSAEGFAAGGVEILGRFCDYLCFGAERGTEETLMATARVLLSPEFPDRLRLELDKGLSFPAARQKAAEALGLDGGLFANPNDILGMEYCKAILSQGCSMQPFVIRREGNYHQESPDEENPSATSLRRLVPEGDGWLHYVPEKAACVLKDAPAHSMAYGQRAVLARLRTMTEDEFAALPYGSEGLWRKLLKACRSCSGLEEILCATKSKRYTRSRLDRMVMCAFLGLSEAEMAKKAPYVRVLGFGEKGKSLLNQARLTGSFPHTGQRTGEPYEARERQWDDLYTLFREQSPGPAGQTQNRRVCII